MTSVPRMANVLGFLGLLPFAGALTGLFFCPAALRGVVGFALLAYGAVIVSFLGGIHWGLLMRSAGEGGNAEAHGFHLVWGVSPSLLAWVALLLPLRWGLLLTALSLLACFAVDYRLYRRAGVAHWMGLRARLTLVAVACCLAGIVGTSI